MLTLLGEDWNRYVRAADGSTIAKLCVVTPDDVLLNDESSFLINTLCDWRNKNANCFLDLSPVTTQSTRRWLHHVSCSRDRLFFLIYRNDGVLTAQYGLRRISSNVVELDNGILGVRGEPTDLFYRVQLHILEICRSRLGFLEAHARVLANNIPALFLHNRCGLKKIKVYESKGPMNQDVLLVGASLIKNSNLF
jgi:hypothetical protein